MADAPRRPPPPPPRTSTIVSARNAIVVGIAIVAFAAGVIAGRVGFPGAQAKTAETSDQYHYEHLKRGVFTDLVRIHKTTGKTEMLQRQGGWVTLDRGQ
jgi:hypothetical protein